MTEVAARELIKDTEVSVSLSDKGVAFDRLSNVINFSIILHGMIQEGVVVEEKKEINNCLYELKTLSNSGENINGYRITLKDSYVKRLKDLEALDVNVTSWSDYLRYLESAIRGAWVTFPYSLTEIRGEELEITFFTSPIKIFPDKQRGENNWVNPDFV